MVMLALAACGDDGGKSGGDGGPIDSAGSDAPPIDGAMIDAPPDGPPPNLTVKNYFAWCSVSVNGAAASTASVQAVNVAPGDITLVATRASSTFQVLGNMWHHTDGDTGTGEPGEIMNPNDPPTRSSTAHVTIGTTAKCVWVCCPFANDASGCESTIPDQCP